MIPNIQFNETSPVIAVMHKMMQLLNLTVDAKERSEQRAGEQTQNAIRNFQKQNQLPVNEKFVVDKPTLNFMLAQLGKLGFMESSMRRTVSGKVQLASGQELHRVPLAAIDLDLPAVSQYKAWESTKELISARDTIEFLGLAESGQDGFYEITFYDWMYEKSERRSADVVVFALNKEENKPAERILGHSALFQNVGYHANSVDITIEEAAKDQGEYKGLLNQINSYLKENGMRLSDIFNSPEQISFVAGELNIPLEKALHIVQANALNYSIQENLEPELLYGLARQKIALDWDSLHRASVDVLETTLAQGMEENDIDTFPKAEIDAFINALKTVTATKILEPGVNEPNITNELLSLSLDNQNERVAFVKASNQYTGTDEKEFWESYLPKQTGFKPEIINSLRQNQKLFALSGAHLPLVTTLAQTDIKELPELVTWDLAKWENVLKETGVPAHIEGENENDKIKKYATDLRDSVNKEYPNTAVHHKISTNQITVGDEVRQHINQFLNTAQDFDIKRSKIKDFKDAIDTVAGDNSAATMGELKELQRLVRINPDTSLIQALKNKNLTSATTISDIPRKTFIDQNWEDFGGRQKAMMVYSNATRIATKVQMTENSVREYLDPLIPAIMRDAIVRSRIEDKIAAHWPGYSEVFNVNLCECHHCNSVYSPAAYFVDLMRYLQKGLANDDGQSPSDSFRDRRPDLFHLPLTCENSNTLIPYIDLANEVMENYIFYTNGDENADDFKGFESADTGDLTEEELRAQAQNIGRETYEILANSIFPFNLPFHLPLEIIDAYSRQLGTSWYEIGQMGLQTMDATMRINILTARYLNLSELEYAAITDKDFDGGDTLSRDYWEYFGYENATTFTRNMAKIPEFLRRTGIAYTNLIVLLQTGFINPHLHLLSYLEEIVNAVKGLGSREIYEALDEEANAIPSIEGSRLPPEIRDALELKNIKETVFSDWLKNHFDNVKRVLTLYEPESKCDLETTEIRPIGSLYGEYEPDNIAMLALNISGFIRLWKKSSWSMEELDAILTSLGYVHLDPEGLKMIAYAKQLITQTELSPKEAAILWGLFDYQKPNNLYAQLFLKRFSEVNEVFVPQSGSELFGNLNRQNRLLSNYTSDILAAYKVNEESLLAIYSHTSVNMETAQLSLENLSLVYRYILFAKSCTVSVSELINFIDIFRLTPFDNPEKSLEAYSKIKAVKSSEFTLADMAYILSFEGFETTKLILNETQLSELTALLIKEFTSIDMREVEIPEGSTEDAVRLELKSIFTYQKLGEMLGLTAEIIIALAQAEIADILEAETFDETAFHTLVISLHRAATVINTFSLSEPEAVYFIENPTDFSELDFRNMQLEAWWRLYDYVVLKEQLPKTDFSLIDIFNFDSATAPIAGDLTTALNLITQWGKDDIELLLAMYNPSEDLRNEIILLKMARTAVLAKQMGIAVETLYSLNSTGTTEEEKFNHLWDNAQLIKHVVKAKYNEGTWTTVATKLNDKLREKQRDALVAHLLNVEFIKNHPLGITDANGLYEFFLIDVQMSACMDTSRVVQASAAIQQFVNRVHLNLEVGISPRALDKNLWEWMQHYRVWEAQMRVLYENYTLLKPEWRQDKSPFFDELVSHLTQNDITGRTAEEAMRGYLKSMSEVANLNVAGSYEEKDLEGNFKCLHVFGHTNHTPYTYYYRTWNEYGKWSAWEKVDAAIQPVVNTEDGGKPGVHLIPVVWKNRLLLFWPEFTEKTEAIPIAGDASFKDLSEENVAAQTPKKYWEVRLAWSEYYDQKWTAKQVSERYIKPFRDQRFKKAYEISFSSYILESNELLIVMEEVKGSKPEISVVILELLLYPNFKIKDLQNGVVDFEDFRNVTNNYYNQVFDNKYLEDKYLYHFMNANSSSASSLTIGANYLKTITNHQLLFPNQLTYNEYPLKYPFFYSAEGKTYFVRPKYLVEAQELLAKAMEKFGTIIGLLFGGIAAGALLKTLEFSTFHHPFVSDFISNLNKNGIGTHDAEQPGLMESDTLVETEKGKPYDDGGETFKNTFDPNFPLVFNPGESDLKDPKNTKAYFKETIDFDKLGANSKYNWELFFHAPLHIAAELSKNGKYKEAMQWFHYIFDPTTDEVSPESLEEVSRFWKVKPFKITDADEFEKFIDSLMVNTGGEENPVVKEWRSNPFNPHLVASNFPVNYMKYTVLMYVQNLVDWGDSLFRKFTRENVYEAIQLYVIAGHILGPKPPFVPKRGSIKSETFDTLRRKLNDLNNARVELENSFIYSSDENALDGKSSPSLLGSGLSYYFCIPPNEKLLQYWETVEDRLFKIRNCKDINGVTRRLALFAPPIDPAALIKAKSVGLDLGDILANLNTPAPHYRFPYLLQKANEFCNDVKGLGNALLSAIEKQDGEALGRLRSTHEIEMLQMIQKIKERQIIDAEMVIKQLLKQRETAIYRFAYYNETLLGNEAVELPVLNELDPDLTDINQIIINPPIPERETDVNIGLLDSDEEGVKIISKEKEDLDKRKKSENLTKSATASDMVGSTAALFPNIEAKIQPFGVGVGSGYGGQNIANAAQLLSSNFRGFSSLRSQQAAMSSTVASYIRREQEWTHQANIVAKEIGQIERQILSAGIRLQVAEKDLGNHKKQIENSNTIETYLKEKFTNKELYAWMKDQLKTLHKQSFDLAFNMAKMAEKAFAFEKGPLDEGSEYIEYSYWDNSKYGLLAGEKLQLAIRQMDTAYQEVNTRLFELTKHVSLKQLNPIELIRLRETGKCDFRLVEELFDLDYPGHFKRTIKSVGISIPCVVGPYTTIPCTVSLVSNKKRIHKSLTGGYGDTDPEGTGDSRFISNNIPVSSIATSSAQSDNGVFELNFRDERYAPFEGAGAISEWGIELFNDSETDDFGKALRQFDYSTISDVIIHVRYTAEEGGLKTEALANLKTYFNNEDDNPASPSFKIFDLKHDFPSEWHRFLHPDNPNDGNGMVLRITKNLFPYRDKSEELAIGTITLIADSSETGTYDISLVTPSGPVTELDLVSDTLGNLHSSSISDLTDITINLNSSEEVLWNLSITKSDGEPLNENELKDMFMVLGYRRA